MTDIPQEAIDVATAALRQTTIRLCETWTRDELEAGTVDVIEAALPFLRSQWERELVRWLHSDDWDDGDIWAFYADAIARSIETRRVAFGEAT